MFTVKKMRSSLLRGCNSAHIAWCRNQDNSGCVIVMYAVSHLFNSIFSRGVIGSQIVRIERWAVLLLMHCDASLKWHLHKNAQIPIITRQQTVVFFVFFFLQIYV